MTRVSKLFSSFTDKKSSFVTHLIERVSGKTLTGYKLNLAHAISIGLLFGFLFSLLDAVLLLLQFGLPHLGGIAANAVFTFSVCFSFAFLVTLLLNLTSDWEDSLKAQHKHYEKLISFIFRLITLPLILLILWLYFSSLPFSRYDDKVRSQELISICEECMTIHMSASQEANVLAFYLARCSVTAKRLLNGPAHLNLGITDANGICFLREQLIYRFRHVVLRFFPKPEPLSF